MGDRVISAFTTGVSKSIAIASTALVGQKHKSKAKSTETERKLSINSNSSDDIEGEGLAFEWALDEAAENEKEPDPQSLEKLETENVDADHFIFSHQIDVKPPPYKRLPQLVSIPQRRPKDRSRGFVRAYAPVLGVCGIDAETFIDFIKGFDRATRTAPIFNIINIACIGIGFAGHVASVVASVVGAANSFAKGVHKTYKGNKFLDEVNEKLFKPRGLYVLIMSYQPQYKDDPLIEADDSNKNTDQENNNGNTTLDDASQATVKTLTDQRKLLRKKLLLLKSTSGRFKTEQSIPPLAPLVYPDLDRRIDAADGNSNNSTGQIALTRSNVEEYLDRRAQVKAAANHRQLSLAQTHPPLPPTEQKEFINRFCDPDHPVNSGSIFGLVTGGTWDPIAAGRVSRAKKAAKKRGEPELTEEELHNVYMGRGVRGRKGAHEKRRFTITDNILQKDLLYMCVVNLPSEEELKEMQQMMGDS